MPADRDAAPLRALQIFVELVRRERFAGAAARFGVTTSAVSHQIRALGSGLN